MQREALKTVAITGLIAGSLDITAACVQFYLVTGGGPVRVLRFVASGVFGSAAFSEDPLMPVLGLVFHYAIATTFAAIFFFAYPRVAALGRRPVVTGLVYGVVVWSIMNLVVLPASQVSRRPLRLGAAVPAMVILMFAIGLPISLATHRHYTRRAAERRER